MSRKTLTTVIDRNICHFLWYGVVAGDGLRSVGEGFLRSTKSVCSILLLPIAICGPGLCVAPALLRFALRDLLCPRTPAHNTRGYDHPLAGVLALSGRGIGPNCVLHLAHCVRLSGEDRSSCTEEPRLVRNPT